MDDRDRQRLGNLIGHAQAAIGYARAQVAAGGGAQKPSMLS
jgi:hypothetical protein